jgi:FAD/FMN-containing dehydrogenase
VAAVDTASEADWRHLERSVSGRVLRPGAAGFQDASAPFNKRFTHGGPAGVVSVASVADVQRAVRWARATGTPIVPRGGGHSYAGHSVNDGLVVDVRALSAVTADGSAGRVTAAGGASMAALYAAIEPEQIAFALGNGASVGIAGLTLGGGSAATSRSFGLTADALLSTTLVTADGELVTCDAEHHPDLFWACRGGGGGNFGINVSFTYRAFPVADCATCLLLWDGADAPKVFAVLQDVMRHAPDELSIRLGASTADGAHITVSAIGLHLGPARELRELLDPVLAVARPVREDIADRTFWQAQQYLLHETSAGAFAVRTNFAAEPLPPEAVAEALAHLHRWPGGTNPDGGGLALFGWGGAVNEVAPDATAFPHRDAHFLVNMDTSWGEQDGPGAVPAHLRWLGELREIVAPHVLPGAYVNFADPDLADWRTAYYGANYPRLVEVKRRYDPDALFTFAQAVGS